MTFGRRSAGGAFSAFDGLNGPGPSGRRRGPRLPRFVPSLLALATLAGVAALWVWAFAPIFVEPQEFHGRQRRFDRVVREVVQPTVGHGGGAVPDLPVWPPRLTPERARVVACAEAQVARGVRHTPSFHPVDFPWGDVPAHLGTTADLLVRCLRDAGLDLQQLIAIDRKATPKNYPLHLWAARRPDRGVDHRRLPNLYAFAKLYLPPAALEVVTTAHAAAFIPGDVVFWNTGGARGYPSHAGLVIDRRGPDGMPWVVTIAPGEGVASLHHRIDDWPVQGHFSLDLDLTLERFLEANPGATLIPRPIAAPATP